jgi:hypothetical protein
MGKKDGIFYKALPKGINRDSTSFRNSGLKKPLEEERLIPFIENHWIGNIVLSRVIDKTGAVAKAEEHLLYKCEALSLNPSPTKKRKKEVE